MIERYELRDSDGDLVRIFLSKEEASKFVTSGDYLVKSVSILPPKMSLYDYAIKKVGYSSL
jgi:hypothetical protein